MKVTLIGPLINDRSALVRSRPLYERNGIGTVPPRQLLIVCWTATMAEHVPVVLRVIKVSRVRHETATLQRLFASTTNHAPRPNVAPHLPPPGEEGGSAKTISEIF
jgi:hypothetical protein